MVQATHWLSCPPTLVDREQVAHPGNVTPTLTRQLAGNTATPALTGPSLTYNNQTLNVAVDARAIWLEVTEVRQEAERRHQQAIQQLEAATSMQVHSSEQRAQQRHEEIVADMENPARQPLRLLHGFSLDANPCTLLVRLPPAGSCQCMSHIFLVHM